MKNAIFSQNSLRVFGLWMNGISDDIDQKGTHFTMDFLVLETDPDQKGVISFIGSFADKNGIAAIVGSCSPSLGKTTFSKMHPSYSLEKHASREGRFSLGISLLDEHNGIHQSIPKGKYSDIFLWEDIRKRVGVFKIQSVVKLKV